MINETGGLDNRDPSTWRDGEKVEAVLITERGPGTLIRIGHPDGPFYVDAAKFASVRPVDGDTEHLKTVKALRLQLVEERLAAATARSDTAMADKEVERLHAEVGRLHADGAAVMRAYRLAVAALERIRTLDSAGPLPPLPFLDVLLPSADRQGSLAQPCDATLKINQRYPGCGCDEPCLTEVAELPCMLPRGHAFVSGAELHRSVDGQEFETGESMVVGDDE